MINQTWIAKLFWGVYIGVGGGGVMFINKWKAMIVITGVATADHVHDIMNPYSQ